MYMKKQQIKKHANDKTTPETMDNRGAGKKMS